MKINEERQESHRPLTPGVLLLEDGSKFSGTLFGAPISADTIRNRAKRNDYGYGETVFNTAMTGYQEIITDPSYYGQLICFTAAHIGNTGVNLQDEESRKAWCSGVIVRELCLEPSSWRSEESLNDYLVRNQIPGLCGVDTRSLTRHLRSKGVVRGIILPHSELSQGAKLLDELPKFEGRNLIQEVSTPEPYFWTPQGRFQKSQRPDAQYRVVCLDFGTKKNSLNKLYAAGCEVEVVPASISAQEILDRKPDGVFLSNGPGDPAAAPNSVETVRGLIGQVPLFGICMGHHILALALGGRTYKLKFGHRGGNHPILNRKSGRVEISAHNHGYAVSADSLPKTVEITHINLNDQTVEGLQLQEGLAFSVQYHPEACPGPHDSMELFDQFIQNIEKHVSKISRTHH